ncbi:hypothetical protein [Haloarcula sp. JP-L23]|uniref:DUF7344 domain-containing protein n=1 Tax=Haloarcula sp. JP-L23 TaxID=2716717 RepID=UPI00140EACEF|nr:hypothetical protein G9465_19680 [Haloarcula sp. JP-L23]
MILSKPSARPSWLSSDEDESSDPDRQAPALDEDAVYDLLGNERRRVCLKLLSQSDEVWDVSDLSERVAEIVSDPSTSPDDIYNSVYISLCQNHLPKLDEVDLVEYDSEAKTIHIGPAFDDIGRHWLADDQQPDTSPPAFRLTLAASVITVFAAGTTLLVAPALTSFTLPALLALHLLVLAVEAGIRQFS